MFEVVLQWHFGKDIDSIEVFLFQAFTVLQHCQGIKENLDSMTVTGWRMVKVRLSSTENQRRSCYSCTISQPYLETQRLTSSAMSEDVDSRDALPKKHQINMAARSTTSCASANIPKAS